jgi:hypothetical protein
MKKIVLSLFVLGCAGSLEAVASVEQYVNSVEKIRAVYAQDIRGFLRSLDPQISQFTPEQQAQYCGINQRYIQAMSEVIQQNRSSLPRQYASMNKQDLIKQVVESKEMQMLAKYKVQCDFQ